MSFKNKLIGSDGLNSVFQELREYFTHNCGEPKANKDFNLLYIRCFF